MKLSQQVKPDQSDAHESLRKTLRSIPRLELASTPTALEKANNLAQYLGVESLYIKRDDLTGLAMGGNKARKLEYELAPLLEHQIDTIVTVGGTQSNHARMAAAAARKLGMDIKLVLGGDTLEELQGNVLLDVVLDAEIRYLVGRDDETSLHEEMLSWVAELNHSGHKAYALPLGGSTPLGCLGYVQGMLELADQLDLDKVQIILPVGSCGTLAGCLLGTKLIQPNAQVFGISVSRSSPEIANRVMELTDAAANLLGLPNPVAHDDLHIIDSYMGTYGIPTPETLSAIQTSARLEGLLLDPIYTGKAMVGLFDLLQKGILDKTRPLVFLHTGGTPILFAFSERYREQARIDVR